jgi:hypothetical protein
VLQAVLLPIQARPFGPQPGLFAVKRKPSAILSRRLFERAGGCAEQRDGFLIGFEQSGMFGAERAVVTHGFSLLDAFAATLVQREIT